MFPLWNKNVTSESFPGTEREKGGEKKKFSIFDFVKDEKFFIFSSGKLEDFKFMKVPTTVSGIKLHRRRIIFWVTVKVESKIDHIFQLFN